MAIPIHLFTLPVVVPTAGLTLGLEINCTVGGVAKNLTAAVLAHPVLPEGTYPYFVFLAKTNVLLRQWILDAATAQGITTRPSLANTRFFFTLPATLVPTANGNKLTVSFNATGFAIGGNAMVLTGGNLVVNGEAGLWTKLGMIRDSTATMAHSSVTATDLIWNGAQQPSYLFVFERQGKDEGEREQVKGNTRVLRDGTIRQHRFGSSRVPRVVRLFEHESPMLGARIPAATHSSINGARSILTLKTQDEDGLVNLSMLYQNEDLISTGVYVRVGLSRHVTRLDAKAGSPKTTTATLFENASANAATEMTAGMTVYRCSEFEALMWRYLEVGYLLYHEPNDTTQQARFKGEAYALDFGDGELDVTPVRVDDFFDLFEFTFFMVSRDVPELTL